MPPIPCARPPARPPARPSHSPFPARPQVALAVSKRNLVEFFLANDPEVLAAESPALPPAHTNRSSFLSQVVADGCAAVDAMLKGGQTL